jgi:hypothetical protein
MQDRVAGPVSCGTGALHRRAVTEILHVAAERALVDLAVLGAAERHAVVLKLIDRRRRLTRQVFHRIGVAQPVRALHRVVHVPLPVVRTHVLQAGRNAALRRHRVRTRRKHLADARGTQALLRHAQRGAKTRTAGPDHHHVELVIDIFV